MPRRLTLPQRAAIRGIQLGFSAGGLVSPEVAARVAEYLLIKPPRPPKSRCVSENPAQEIRAHVDEGEVVFHRFGAGAPVFFMHGWGGRGFQLSSFVDPLIELGMQPILIDAPGHGFAKARTSSIIAFGDALLAAQEQFGTPQAVVAHSLGALGTVTALHKSLTTQRLVFIGPRTSLESATRWFQGEVGLTDPTVERLKQRLERRYRSTFGQTDSAKLDPSKKVPLLVFHDLDDEEVAPHESGTLVAHWPGSHRVLTNDLGHYRILRSESVIEGTTRFIATGVPPTNAVPSDAKEPS